MIFDPFMGCFKIYTGCRIGSPKVLELEGSADLLILLLVCGTGVDLADGAVGSLPSALTRLSLPAAIPLGHICLAAFELNSTTLSGHAFPR